MTDAPGKNRGHRVEVIPRIQGRKVVVLLRVGRIIFVAQAEEQGQVGEDSPAVLAIGIPGILPQIGFLIGGLQRSLLRQTKQQSRQAKSLTSEVPPLLPLEPGAQ